MMEHDQAGHSIVHFSKVLEHQFIDYISEWEQTSENVVPTSTNRNGRSFKEMQEKWAEAETEAAFQRGYVPSTVYFFVAEQGFILGSMSFRHCLNDRLLQNGGHIGYGVRPTMRVQGLAKAMLSRFLISGILGNLEKVLLTCDEDNIPSRKTIEACGGTLWDKLEFEGTWTRRYWIEIDRTRTERVEH